MKYISCGCRHNAEKCIQNTNYKSTHAGLCYSCCDEELFKSGSRRKKKKPSGFSQTRTSLSCYMCFPRDESLVHFSLGAPTNKSSGCFAFSTLAADVFMGLLHVGDEHIYTIFPNFPIVSNSLCCGFRCFALGCSSNAVCPVFGSIEPLSACSWSENQTEPKLPVKMERRTVTADHNDHFQVL